MSSSWPTPQIDRCHVGYEASSYRWAAITVKNDSRNRQLLAWKAVSPWKPFGGPTLGWHKSVEMF